MSGSRLERFVDAADQLRLACAGEPFARTRANRDAYDIARARLLDTKTDETGPVHAVSAERAADLAPPTPGTHGAVSALEQAAEELRAALARIEDASDVAAAQHEGYLRATSDEHTTAAEVRGYARCQADVVAHYTASPDDMEIDDFVESVELGGHVGAAARAKEKP